MIRRCDNSDFDTIWTIINDGAQAYKGIIPADRWTEPYMSREELQRQISEEVVFYGYEDSGTLTAVMGIQNIQNVTLIRHAYVRTAGQRALKKSLKHAPRIRLADADTINRPVLNRIEHLFGH